MKKRRNRPTRHHRKPRCCGGSDCEENISWVPSNQHEAYHILFGHGGDVNLTVKRLNELWIDPKYQLVVVEVIKLEISNQLKQSDDGN